MSHLGRKPKPTALHRLHGTYRPSRHRNREAEPPAPTELEIEPPDDLTAGQAAAWRHVIAHAPLGILRQIDTPLLLCWVEVSDRHRRAVIAQAAFESRNPAWPLLRLNKRGEPVASPYIREIDRAAQMMVTLASELGFSPTARPRLVRQDGPPPPTEPMSGWAKLRVLRGGKA